MKAHNGTTAQTKANEFLAQAHIDDKYIVFFVNENGNVACAIMKKKLLSYDVLRISGELSIRKDNENYLFSAYEDNGYEWIDWGLISESDIDKILVNGKEMNIIDNLQYSFRICWITGNGEENIPSNHEEIKKGGVIKLFEGLPKFMRVSREGLTLLECQFLRVWFEGLV